VPICTQMRQQRVQVFGGSIAMFRGKTTLNMDEKGRMAVPSRYRADLNSHAGGCLVMTISLKHPCLAVYPFPEWQRIENQLKGMPAFDDDAQTIRHLLIGHAVECELDGSGRILIAPALREFAGLKRRITMIGQASKFELWDDDAWAARQSEALSNIRNVLKDPSPAMQELVL
jgi:MraZ protein